jgi:hypothetical protein
VRITHGRITHGVWTRLPSSGPLRTMGQQDHRRAAGWASPRRLQGLWVVVVALVLSLPPEAARSGGPTLRERLQGPLVAAHRGGRRHDDENTLRRFEAARRAGADIIEMDLQATRDGQVVLMHDARLEDWTDCQGRVADKSFREIRACRRAGSGLPLNTFEDALRWSAGRVVLDADWKDRRSVEGSLKLVREYDAYNWVYFEVGDGLNLYEQVRSLDRRIGPPRPAGRRPGGSWTTSWPSGTRDCS